MKDPSERLFNLAVRDVKRRAGKHAWYNLLSPELREALIMNEITYIVGCNEETAAGAMYRLVLYARTHAHEHIG